MTRRHVVPRRANRSLVGDSVGAVLIEFAFALPLLMLIITGIFEFGFTFREYLLVTNAAREGARMAILPGYSDDDVKARVRDYLTKAGGLSAGVITDPEVTTATPDGTTYTVKTVTVRVNHTFSIIAPFGTSLGTIPLTAVSVMRSEVAAEGTP